MLSIPKQETLCTPDTHTSPWSLFKNSLVPSSSCNRGLPNGDPRSFAVATVPDVLPKGALLLKFALIAEAERCEYLVLPRKVTQLVTFVHAEPLSPGHTLAVVQWWARARSWSRGTTQIWCHAQGEPMLPLSVSSSATLPSNQTPQRMPLKQGTMPSPPTPPSS